MNLFDILGNIYKKNKVLPEVDTGFLIVISKYLSLDKNNIDYLGKIIKYILYIEPIHYYYLLFFNIPKKQRAPFLNLKKESKKEHSELIKKIQSFFDWSERELEWNMSILNKIILKDKKKLEEGFGL